ncbi:MAG: hypothetical protein WBN71_11895 [Acidimicrobiia bacterium]
MRSLWAAVVLLVPAGLLVAACGSGTSYTATNGATVDGPVIASEKTAESGGEDAKLTGTVVLNGACLELHSMSGETYAIAWPKGTTWDENEVAVLLSNGRLVRDGDSISGGGGYHSYSSLDPVTVSAARDCGVGQVAVLNGDPNEIEISRP